MLGKTNVITTIKTVGVNNQNKIIKENGIYNADEGYTGLGTVIVDVVNSGQETLKTIQTMRIEFDNIKITTPNGNKDISGGMILPMGNDFSFGTIKYDMGFIPSNLTYVE